MHDESGTARFRVEGMDCASCASKIDSALRRLDGVRDVTVSVVAGTMTVTYDEPADLAAIARKVSDLGYKTTALAPGRTASRSDEPDARGAGPLSSVHGHPVEEGAWYTTAKARLTLFCGAAVVVAFALGLLFPAAERWVFLLAMAVGLVPIARRALSAAMNGSPFTIETLMTVAAIGAIFIDAAEEAAVVVLLFLIGELLEGAATGRARSSIRSLIDLVPRTAWRDADGAVTEVPADSLAIDDIVLVRPGDRLPADGVVISGESTVDEASVTGESVPKRKQAAETVFAGTINQDGALRVRVTARAADNTIARVVALVEEAQEAKAPTERFIDWFSKYYTPGVMAFALLVAVLPPLVGGAAWDVWIYRALAVLLIGCPCALVISTPAAIAAALSAGARRGLLMKGGAVLENLGRIDVVALDKTGTLTEGRPRVTDVIAIGMTEAELLGLAAGLELGSSHPLAKAILARAEADGIVPVAVEKGGAIGGKGVAGEAAGVPLFLGSPSATIEYAPLGAALDREIAALNDAGKTVSILVSDGKIAGAIAMRDEPRDDAQPGLAAIRALGARVIMLTGDNVRTAAAIAADLDIEVQAGLLPQDKQQIVGALKAEGRRVAKVGDGINDAPALAAADIGIAMGGGADVALETADAAVLHGRVTDVADMIGLSRATMANIAQNITISLGLKALLLVTTLLGITGLWPAILADTGATVLVTANALRLLAWRGSKTAAS